MVPEVKWLHACLSFLLVLGSMRRFKNVSERLQAYLVSRAQSVASPDMGSDEEVLREDISSSTPIESDSAFQAVSSPDPSTGSPTTGNDLVGHDQVEEGPNKVPKRKLSKRKNFTRTYPKSEDEESSAPVETTARVTQMEV